MKIIMTFLKLSRGLKKGDPLSLALFIIEVEVLARGLNKLWENKEFIGYDMPEWSERINHLSYADDIILFWSGHKGSVKKMMTVLRQYEDVLGQLINPDKSLIYLHKKVPISICHKIKRWTGIKQGKFPFTYLGYSIFYGRKKNMHFECE